MKSRMDVLKKLLFEINDICSQHGLQYTLVGEIADEIIRTGNMPEHFDYAAVAMTMGDIERFIEVVNNDGRTDREVEYLLNNSKAGGLQIRYCDCSTTLINVKEIGRHTNYGIFVVLLPIDKGGETRAQQNLLKLYKKALKGSTKSFDSCTFKKAVPVAMLKCMTEIIGNARVRRIIFDYNNKLHYIDKWADISKFDAIAIGKASFDDITNWGPKTYKVDGKKLKIVEAVFEKNIKKYPRKETVQMNDIVDTEVPFNEVLDSEIVCSLQKVQAKRNAYLKKISKATKATKVTNRGWKTYIMTRDVVELESIYSEEELNRLEGLIDEEKYNDFMDAAETYITIRDKWTRTSIPFINIPKLDSLIEKVEQLSLS